MNKQYEKLQNQLAMTFAALLSLIAPDATVQKIDEIVMLPAAVAQRLEEEAFEQSMSYNPFGTPLPKQDPASAIPKCKPEWTYLDDLEIGQTKEMALKGIKPDVIVQEKEIIPRQLGYTEEETAAFYAGEISESEYLRLPLTKGIITEEEYLAALRRADNGIQLLALSKEKGLRGGIQLLDDKGEIKYFDTSL